MATEMNTTGKFSIATFGDDVMTIDRRINALRLVIVGLHAEGWRCGYKEVEQAVIDLQLASKNIERHYKAMRAEMGLGKDEDEDDEDED